MEELFQNMKTSRSQVNDVAEANELSIQSVEKDLDSVRNETSRVNEDTESMAKEKGQFCFQILEKQRKFTLLESDSSSLNQTLKLKQLEKLSLSTELDGNSAYYKEAGEGMMRQLQEQQKWDDSQSISSQKPKSSLIHTNPFDGNSPRERTVRITGHKKQTDNAKELIKDDMNQIWVKLFDGDNTPIMVRKSDTIESVKKQISEKKGILIAVQELAFCGVKLLNGCTIDFYNIEKGSTLNLCARLRGGTSVRRNQVVAEKNEDKTAEKSLAQYVSALEKCGEEDGKILEASTRDIKRATMVMVNEDNYAEVTKGARKVYDNLQQKVELVMMDDAPLKVKKHVFSEYKAEEFEIIVQHASTVPFTKY